MAASVRFVPGVARTIGANTTSVAVVDGTVAGVVNVIIKPDDASGEIYMIAVDPGHAPARRTYEAAGFTPWPHVTYVKLLD